jgi:hypothetical protein
MDIRMLLSSTWVAKILQYPFIRFHPLKEKRADLSDLPNQWNNCINRHLLLQQGHLSHIYFLIEF